MLPFIKPPRTGNERETLKAFLDGQRSLLLWKLEGLQLEEASRSTVPSATSLLGLVKHMAWVEQWWFLDFIGGAKPDYPWSEEDPDADWRIEDGETIESISRFYVDSVGEANAVIDGAESLDVTGTIGGHPRSLRWVLVHMIEETARHAGHADIIREQVDGTVGYMPDD
jgi:hypothetical protein